MGFSENDLYVIFNSLDYERHLELRDAVNEDTTRALRQSLFDNPDLPVLLCSARMNRSKRLDLLIHAAASLYKQGSPVNVLLIGDGDAKAELELLAKECAVDAYFVGACFDDAKIAEYTMMSDLTVCPGATGLTVMQSLTFGIPVVTNDDFSIQGPEVEAVIEAETGAFFTAGDHRSLSEAIVRMIGLSDADKHRISEKCMKVVEVAYNPRNQAQLISEAVKGAPAREETLSDLLNQEGTNANETD